MEQVTDLVVLKKQRIQNLESKKIKTEEQIEQVELTLEDIKDKLDINYQELSDLVTKDKNSKDAQVSLGKLMGKNFVTSLILLVMGTTINIAFIYFIMLFLLISIPKYIKLINEIKRSWGIDFTSDIKMLREKIASLESDKDRIAAVLRKLEYTIADIDSEKKVMEDILNFISENRGSRENETAKFSEINELNRTRINPTCS